MAFGDKVPVREYLLEKVWPLIDKYKGRLVVLDYDVTMQTLPGQGGFANVWAVVVLTRGALIGPQHYLSYVYTLTQTPQLPTDEVLDRAISDCCAKLSLMLTRQLQTQAPPGLGGHSTN